MNEIIITCDSEGRLATFSDAKIFMLYRNSDGVWKPCDTQPICCAQDAAGIRSCVNDLANYFQDCRIIVSRKISGIAYQMLDKMGYAIFEADAATDELFDRVVEDIDETQRAGEAIAKEPYSPEDDGNYFLNLVKLQKACPEISSKKALMRFMQDQPFLSLELICNHLPPWMEDIMGQRGLSSKIQTIDGGLLKASIFARACTQVKGEGEA